MSGNIREMFPGGNTSAGFYSYYKYILSQNEAKRIIVIKGGPGTGKSTLMKRVARFFNEKGYDIELHHCSSDNNSLDGVVIPEVGIALLDGTAPHVVDPINPGAVDEILHMGDFWNEDELKKNKERIINTNLEVGRTFARAYKYIKAARAIFEDWEEINSQSIDKIALNKALKKLETEVFKNSRFKAVEARERHLFATAITPKGIITLARTLVKEDQKVFILKSQPGSGRDYIMEDLYKEAIKKGIDVEVYHQPFIPERIEYLIFKNLGVAILTENEINREDFSDLNPLKIIDTDQFLDKDYLDRYEECLIYDMDKFYELLNKAIDTIGMAKKLHDYMETFYIPNMDFNAIERVYDDIIKKLTK